ncbi:hypothetical protein GCM10029964_047060 [Kibdelosporangium lantanae]
MSLTERPGAHVVALDGFAPLKTSAAAPLAAEHPAYAERLVDDPQWTFWWN